MGRVTNGIECDIDSIGVSATYSCDAVRVTYGVGGKVELIKVSSEDGISGRDNSLTDRITVYIG